VTGPPALLNHGSPYLTVKAKKKQKLAHEEAEVDACPRKADIGLAGKGKLQSYGVRPVHQIISITKWIRTSRLSIKDSLSDACPPEVEHGSGLEAFSKRGGKLRW